MGSGALKNVKIVYIVTVPITAKAFLNGHLAFIREQGHDVTLIASPEPLLAQVAAREGVNYAGIEMKRDIAPFADLKSLWQLFLTLKRLKPDAVTAGTPKAGLLGMIASWLLGVKLRTYVLHGLRIETLQGKRRAIVKATDKLSAWCAHKVVCVSPSLRRRYLEEGMTQPNKVIIMANGSANGVSQEQFRPRSQDTQWQSLKALLGIPSHVLVVGFVGRFVRDKGMIELVHAYQTLRQTHPELCLLLVGQFENGDPLPTELDSYLREALANSVKSRVYGTGWVDDVSPYFAVMDVFAFPTYREGFPISPLEASMCEVPIVGTYATGVIDAVRDGETGLLVPVGDKAAFTSALDKLLCDAELRQKLGQAGRQRTLSTFSPQQIWQAWAKYYDEFNSDH
jgi:glycosyltransferase involved in cell wall biosynthesis